MSKLPLSQCEAINREFDKLTNDQRAAVAQYVEDRIDDLKGEIALRDSALRLANVDMAYRTRTVPPGGKSWPDHWLDRARKIQEESCS
jgi:hypothetical protein